MLQKTSLKLVNRQERLLNALSRQGQLGFLEVGLFYSTVGLRLTCRFLSGRNANNFFPVEEATPKDTAYC